MRKIIATTMIMGIHDTNDVNAEHAKGYAITVSRHLNEGWEIAHEDFSAFAQYHYFCARLVKYEAYIGDTSQDKE